MFGLGEGHEIAASVDWRKEAKMWKRGTNLDDGATFPSHVYSRTLAGIGETLHLNGIVEITPVI
jgi:hypothetical protein